MKVPAHYDRAYRLPPDEACPKGRTSWRKMQVPLGFDDTVMLHVEVILSRSTAGNMLLELLSSVRQESCTTCTEVQWFQ